MSCFQEDLGEGVDIVAHGPGPGLDRVAGRWEWTLLKTVFFSRKLFAKKMNIRVSTEFVLLADDLDWGGGWINLERSIRLLTQVESTSKGNFIDHTSKLTTHPNCDYDSHTGWVGVAWCWRSSEELNWPLVRALLPDQAGLLYAEHTGWCFNCL